MKSWKFKLKTPYIKTVKFLSNGISICLLIFIASFILHSYYMYSCPREYNASSWIPMESHGVIFYLTSVEYILLAILALTGGLGIIVFGLLTTIKRKKKSKITTDYAD